MKEFFKKLINGEEKEKEILPPGRADMVIPKEVDEPLVEGDLDNTWVIKSLLPIPYTIGPDHKLNKAKYVQDPDVFPPKIMPKGIVVHFTCSYTLDSTIDWFKNNVVDIHLLLDKNGEFTQMVPFNQKAAHAGMSKWKGYNGLNSYFIGIEVINIGPLKKSATTNKTFFDCYGKIWKGNVYEYEKPVFGYKYWEPFTFEQMDSLVNVCASLCLRYKFDPRFICGHHEASPGRKNDPGGSLTITMDLFREMVKAEIGRRNLHLKLS
jgi:N-acetylmuramoyl-L-alanine amidase